MLKNFTQTIIDGEQRAVERQLGDGHTQVVKGFAPNALFRIIQGPFVRTRLNVRVDQLAGTRQGTV